MALDHLQALADYIKGENVSHISGLFFSFNIRLRWNQHCSQILRSEETHTFCPTDLYFMNFVLRPVQKWQFSLGPALINWLTYCMWSFLTSRHSTYLGDQQNILIPNQKTEIQLETHVLFQFCCWKYFPQMALLIGHVQTIY